MKLIHAVLSGVFLLVSGMAGAQGFISTQSHEGKVSAFYPLESSEGCGSFYSAGDDGFIVKWSTEDNLGLHYQLTDLGIQKISRNPSTGDLAIYETNGISIFRITVIDSKSYARRYTKRYQNPVTTLAFSEQGTYLIAATSNVDGCYIYDAKSGNEVVNIKGISGTVTMVKTGATEKSAVLYSTTNTSANLYFYDLTKKKILKRFPAEYMLEHPVLFGSGKYANRFLAGIRTEQVDAGGTKYDYWGKVDKKEYKEITKIFVIDTMNGKTLGVYEESSPLIFASPLDSESEGLYIVSTKDRKSYIKTVLCSELEQQIAKIKKYEDKGQTAKVESAVLNPPAAKEVKNFANPKNKETFTCASKDSKNVYLGTSAGNIITFTDRHEAAAVSSEPITAGMYKKIRDIACNDRDFFLLTDEYLFKSSYELGSIEKICSNPKHHTNIALHGGDAILWSRSTNKTVQKVSVTAKNQTPSDILKIDGKAESLHVAGDKIVYVDGDTDVFIYNFKTNRKSRSYFGTAIQDVAVLNDQTIYVAKSNSGNKNDSLISVNLKTGEAISLKVDANVCYSLACEENAGCFYGIAVKQEKGKNVSELFSYDIKSGKSKTLLRLKDEDSSAFTNIFAPYVYTNLGRNQMYACNTETRKNILYRRSASMPLKAARNGEKIVVLNCNGSISWYNVSSQASLGDWYLTVSDEWFEL